MVAEMRSFLYGAEWSSTSEPAPMYTPARSLPLSPPSGQSPPTQQQDQSESLPKKIHPSLHLSNPCSDCSTLPESVRTHSIRTSVVPTQLKESMEKSEPNKIQERSKYSRNMHPVHLKQSYTPAQTFSNNGHACYEQYYSHPKTTFSSESNPNMYYATNQEKPTGDNSLNVNNKTCNELNSYYNAKDSERVASTEYSGFYMSSHSQYLNAESFSKHPDHKEKCYTLPLPEINTSSDKFKTRDASFSGECNSLENKVSKGPTFCFNNTNSLKRHATSLTDIGKSATTSNSDCGGSQQTTNFDNLRKVIPDHSGLTSMGYDPNVSENEKNDHYETYCNEMNITYFKQEICHTNHSLRHPFQAKPKLSSEERLQISPQNNDISYLKRETNIAYVQPKSQVSDASLCELKDLSMNAITMHQKQYENDALEGNLKQVYNRESINEARVDDEKTKTTIGSMSKTSPFKSAKQNYTRGVIFKPYSYNSKKERPKRNSEDAFYPKVKDVDRHIFGPKFKAQIVEESDGGSDGEKASCSTASLYSASPSPSIGTAESVAPVDLRRAASDSDDQHVPHVFIPGQNNQQGSCLVWACKACKKKSVSVNTRARATIRERKRLGIVNEAYEALKLVSSRDPNQRLAKVDILKNAIEYIESLEDILQVSSSPRERDCDSGGSDYGAVNSPPYLDEHYQHFSKRIHFSSTTETSEASTNNVSSLDYLSLIVQSINPDTSSLLSAITMDSNVPDLDS